MALPPDQAVLVTGLAAVAAVILIAAVAGWRLRRRAAELPPVAHMRVALIVAAWVARQAAGREGGGCDH